MGASVHDRHVLLDRAKELVEPAIEASQKEPQGGDRGHGPAVFHRAHVRTGHRHRDGGLAQASGESPPSKLTPDRGGQPVMRRLFGNS
jgi:hypothetical protein